ncbi:ThiF family adenylyltransferase [Gordonia sp. HY002]|uniref:ThiF family adenylyltransferase n=1 Tax=Gordonia zhenghanii TaxID=2911516 RepID=UPI001EF040BD|nr:ThiF family adenylyltransferase [Gordonia zhenghanii]MCF8571765.1 ThiF family adenylyltransferase [Gordonia zhenghanii]MCF8604910.1 ThiF family adenylyltransferase [Gordonia zhenghanii]
MPIPPLVEPAPSIPDDERLRAARQIRLPEIGDAGQRRLANAKVCVIGAGGLGSPVLLYLASAGVGVVGIVDDDDVDTSNLQRQIVFGVDDVGRPKATVAAERVRTLSPRTQVIEHRLRLTADNAAELFAPYDLVIDGSDSFDTRYAVADACAEVGLPLVWGSVLRFDAQATVFWSAPPAGAPITLRDVFPAPPPAGEVPNCAEAGVLGALCGQLGGILVTEAVKLICGVGEPLLNRMLVLDALGARIDEVPIGPAAAGAQIGRVRVDDSETITRATLLDVRNTDEVARGSLPGAQHVPLDEVLADAASVPVGEVTVVYCQLGPRSRAAAHALAAQHPDTDVRVLLGGYAAWAERSTL